MIGHFRKRGSVDNVPKKGNQAYLDHRDTRKLLRPVTENRKRSLSEVTAMFHQKSLSFFLNELFTELCTSRDILEKIARNVSKFINRKADYLGVEVFGTKLSTTTKIKSSLLMSVEWISVLIFEYLFGGR